MEKLRIMECFGGIGACSKALERLGIDYEIADYVEIDKYAVKSFNAMHGTNFTTQDVTTWDKNIEVDLLMHGSPCQDFSLAGKQAGGDKDSGTRSSLMYETIRIVEKLKPKYVIWENVKNLLSKKHRHNFDAYLKTMEQLGYKNYYQVLNAKDYGIPQNRERVFTVSVRDDSGIRKSTFLGTFYLEDYEANNFKFPPKQELKLKLKDMLEDDVEEKYYLSDKAINKMKRNLKNYKPCGLSPTLTTELEHSTGKNLYPKLVCEIGYRRLTPKECWRLMGFDDEDFEKAEKVNSNTQLYKQAGNSIVVNVLESILKELLLNE